MTQGHPVHEPNVVNAAKDETTNFNMKPGLDAAVVTNS